MRAIDFILEQAINTTSVYDIEMEQLIAEMEVYSAIIGECEKQSMILEYATDASVFLEADDGTADDGAADEGDPGEKKKRSFFKKKEKNGEKTDEAKKKWYVAAKEALIKVGHFIMGIFKRTPYDKLIKIVENAPDGTTWEIPDFVFDLNTSLKECIQDYTDLSAILSDHFVGFSNTRADNMSAIDTIVDKIKTRDADLKAGSKDQKYASHSSADVLTLLKGLKDIWESDKVKKLKGALRDLEVSKKDLKTVTKDEYKKFNQATKSLYQQFNVINDRTLYIVNPIVKAQKPKKAKKNDDVSNGGDE